jgi:hypothetical protein
LYCKHTDMALNTMWHVFAGVTLIMDPSVARTAPESLARMGTAFQAAHSACQSKRGRWGMYARPEVAANHQDIGVAALPDAYRATIRRNHAVPLPVRDALKVRLRCFGGAPLLGEMSDETL